MITTETTTAAFGTRRLRHVFADPAVAVMAVVGVLIRVWILLSPQGGMNADEAFMGLQTADILRGNFPIVIGGAAYTGTTDAYILAPVVAVLGQHTLIVKLMSSVLWAVASVLAVGAARRVLSDRWALLGGALVWLTPGALAIVSTRGYPAYGFGLVVVVGTLWAAWALVDQDRPQPLTAGLFGALAGLAFYTHPMFATVAGPVAVVVMVRHRRHGRSFWMPAVAAAAVVNLPFLLWNAKNSWPSLDQPPTEDSTYLGRLRGFFVGLLPRVLGVRRQNGDWTFGRPVGALLVIVVLALAALGAWTVVRLAPWRGAVLAAPLVFVWPLMAALNNLTFVDDGRYGIIAFPVLAIAVAAGAQALLAARPTLWLAVAAGWLLICSVPFLNAEAGRDLGDPNRQTQELIDAVDQAGFDRVAGYYWAVLPLEYQSGGRIRTAVAGNPYVIRLPDTQRLVDATPPERLAYVFPPGPIDPSWVKLPVDRYQQVPVAGLVLYLPT